MNALIIKQYWIYMWKLKQTFENVRLQCHDCVSEHHHTDTLYNSLGTQHVSGVFILFYSQIRNVVLFYLVVLVLFRSNALKRKKTKNNIGSKPLFTIKYVFAPSNGHLVATLLKSMSSLMEQMWCFQVHRSQVGCWSQNKSSSKKRFPVSDCLSMASVKQIEGGDYWMGL